MSVVAFADAFYWIALTNPDDSAHQEAKHLAQGLASSSALVVTTDEILVEYLTFFAGRSSRSRQAAGNNVQRILRDDNVRVIAQSRQSFLDGLSLYVARPDKGYSLPDCVLMNAMRREGVLDVLTADQHFIQEGFRPLFRA